MTDGIAPQFVWNGAGSSVTIVLAVLIAIGLAWRAMRADQHAASRRVVRIGFVLRCASLVVLGILLLQPAWAWTVTSRQLGRIVVAVDVSDSMQAVDSTADGRELLQWGLGLGWLDRQATEQQLAAENIPRDEALAARFKTLRRAEVAARVLTDPQLDLKTTLGRVGELDPYIFAGEAAATTFDNLDSLVTSPSASLQPTTTQFTSILQSTLSSAERKTLGVVLFTDGRDASPSRTLELAKTFGALGVPIYPVLIGSTRRPRDIAMLSVDAPLAAYRGDRPQIRVTFSAHGFESSSLIITLIEQGGSGVTQSQSVDVSGSAQTVTFTVAPEELGRHRYQISIAPQPDETRDDNNEREVVLQVVDDRTHVLLAESEPRWEFRYLETALARDQHVELQTVLFSQPFLRRLDEPFFPRVWPEVADDGHVGRFSSRDLVILGDLDGQQAPAELWAEIEKFVSEQGGTLVLIAGRHNSLLSEAHPVVSKLLPVRTPRVLAPTMTGTEAAGLQGWTWQLTPDGERQTFLQFAADAETNRAIWSVLPGATWAMVGEPKPGATVWAWGQPPRDVKNDNVAAVPLLVHQHFGLGQVVWLATDSTWRWRLRAGDQFHHRFWGQLARWAATTKLSAGNAFVQFGALQSTYAAGEPVTLQARWSAGFARQHPDRQAQVEIRRGDVSISEATLATDPQRPLISSVELMDLPPGDYRARLTIEGITPPPAPVDAEFTIMAPQGTETADITADAAFLQSLAQASGGKLFRLDQLNELPQVFPAFAAVSSLPEERSLWDRWPMLLLLVGLLSGEWWLRRAGGLV